MGTLPVARVTEQDYLAMERAAEGQNCTAVNSDLRIRSPLGDQFYPDVSVVCGPIETHAGNKDVCINPAVIVEVLSPSTPTTAAAWNSSFIGKFHRSTIT